MSVRAAPLREEGRLRSLVDFYGTMMRVSVVAQLQYRVAQYFWMLGMVAEPVIYLVVWSTIARNQGGSVGGISEHTFAAYYIVWTLVRTMNIVFTPYGWEHRIREGELSVSLLRPMHPIHSDIAQFAGGKVIWVVLYLPIAVALTLIFNPTFSVSALEVLVFLVAIWGAYLIRTMFLWLLGMISIWTTRASAAFETFVLAELLLSGRLVPLSLMPKWSQTLAAFLPFKWTFYFPIEVLVGNLSTLSLLGGLGMQALWTAIGAALVVVCFRASVKHYSAVGN
jgi:ABC-2 type transport system permease protein